MKSVQFVFLMITEAVCRLNKTIFFTRISFLYSIIKVFLPLGLSVRKSGLIYTYRMFWSQEVQSGLSFSLTNFITYSNA